MLIGPPGTPKAALGQDRSTVRPVLSRFDLSALVSRLHTGGAFADVLLIDPGKTISDRYGRTLAVVMWFVICLCRLRRLCRMPRLERSNRAEFRLRGMLDRRSVLSVARADQR